MSENEQRLILLVLINVISVNSPDNIFISTKKSIHMKTSGLLKLKHVVSPLLLIVVLFFISSCAEKASFQQSSIVPAAHGKVKVKKDDNNNYNIEVDVTNLAEVEKVYSRSHSYIVWMESKDGDTQKLGQLISEKAFLSKHRKAEMTTVSSAEPVRVFITAERNEDVRYPNNEMILRTRNF